MKIDTERTVGQQEQDRLKMISRNTQMLYEQNEFLKILGTKEIPAVVIGDASLAAYSPNPLEWEFSDIDLCIWEGKQKSLFQICSGSGYKVFSLPEDDEDCIHLVKNEMTIHLHSWLGLFQDQRKDELFNRWIRECELKTVRIGQFSFLVFEDGVNGILLLALIGKGLERGRTSRKLLMGWFAFVDAWLDDEAWEGFRKLTEQFELSEIAGQITQFGLQEGYIDKKITWCKDYPVYDLKKIYILCN